MVSVALRAVPDGLAAAVKLTVPLPDPEPPPVTLSQVAPLVAVQAQAGFVVTFVLPAPPDDPRFWEAADSVKLQVPACEIWRVCPAAVRVAVRAAAFLFCGALKVTVPLPVPLAPDVMVSQVALLVAVQVHPVPVVTLAVPVPPAAATLGDDEDSV
jgi:hypothetical protein